MDRINNRSKYLAKNIALFALNSIGSKIIVFLLVPVYTNALTTQQYGIADLVTTIASLMFPVITLNMSESVMRFCLDDDANCNQVMSVGLVAIAVSFILGLIAFPISACFPEVKQYSLHIYLYCVSLGTEFILSCYLRGKEDLAGFAINNILVTFCTGIFNILFLLKFNMGVSGYFDAYILAYFIGTVYALIRGNIKDVIREFQLKRNLAIAMVKYSFPLIPNSLMWWVTNSSDRIMVTALVGASANGIYGISYKIPTIVSTMSTVFNQAWSYSAIHAEKSKDKEEYSNHMYSALVSFQLLVTGFLLAVMKPLMKLYVNPSYYSAWKYTPYLLIGNYFMSLGTFLSTPYSVHKDSRGYLVSGTIGAMTNIVLNLLLIPRLRVSGAALATCISYIAVFIFRVLDTKKYIKINVLSRKNNAGIVVLIIMAISMFTQENVSNILLLFGFMALVIINYSSIKKTIRHFLKQKTSR